MDSKKPNQVRAKKAVKKGTKAVKQQKQEVPSIKDLLLNGPRLDLNLPKRTNWRHRPPVEFD
jgi:hypothetical protein